MSGRRFTMSSRLTSRLLPLTLAASLMGCSSFSGVIDQAALVDRQWTERNAEKLVTLAAEAEPQASQLPASLRRCLQKSLRDKRAADKAAKLVKAKAAEAKSDTPPVQPSADDLVLAQQKTKRDREACAYQVFMWHESQGKKVAKK